MNTDLKEDTETYAIIGAAIDVHNELISGFLESVYHDALTIEFKNRNIPFEREVTLPVYYKNEKLPSFYRADFICFDDVIIEVKALNSKIGKMKKLSY